INATDAFLSSNDYYRFIFTIATVSDWPTIPSDLALEIYADNPSMTVGGSFYVDHIQIYPESAPYEISTVRYSDAYNPERFDAITGVQYINKDDGEHVNGCAVLRDFCYFFKERSMYVTFNDGTNPPSFWSVARFDDAVGAGGPRCVLEQEEMIIVAGRPGAYIFFGGRPTKLSQEIQTLWATINWQYAQSIHVSIDAERRIIRIFAPLGTNTTCKDAILLDYVGGLGTEVEPGERKWSQDKFPWPVYDHIVATSIDGSNQKQVWLAAAKIYYEAGTTDDSAAIDCIYATPYAKAMPTGQSLFGGCALTVSGTGFLNVTMNGMGGFPSVALPPVPLTDMTGMQKDVELYANIESERANLYLEANGVDNNGVGYSFKLRRAAIYSMPWALARPK
ncbi:MAG: hypothetical protein KGI66_04450, partial [Patescibacteria group bacterium]|nr:hypothetical protein [Patescibacteria group bacterium]